MLDENLPTFYFRSPSNDNTQISAYLCYTQNGSEPIPEYSLQKLDPALPQAKNKYAIALADANAQGIIYAEVLIEPEFQQPSLSAAEIRSYNGHLPPPVPIVPESFTAQLYNPDQQVIIKGEKSLWMGKETFEFEMPQKTFRVPSASQIDRQQNNPITNGMTPKVVFKWKRESKFNKDMTCYMTGRSAGGKKSNEPDITVAMYKHGRERAVTIYEPNLRRVEVEDRKGLEIILLLSAEVIREIYLMPSRDSFNMKGALPGKRKSSATIYHGSGSPEIDPYTMTSGLGISVPTSPITYQPSSPQDAEIRRLHAAQQEEHDIRDRAQQRLIQRMLEDERMARMKREAEVEKETEALRKQFGMEGQVYSAGPHHPPARQTSNPGSTSQAMRSPIGRQYAPYLPLRPPTTEPRPLGVGHGGWITGMTPGQFFGQPQPQPQTRPGRGGSRNGECKVFKKRSTFF